MYCLYSEFMLKLYSMCRNDCSKTAKDDKG